jgi:hypothetical protein
LQLPFAQQAYARPSYGIPEARLVNLFAEGDRRFGRPGLHHAFTAGDGPIRGMFQADGIFGGAVFCTSGEEFYRNATLLGAIPGNGPSRFAASASQLVATSGELAYCWDGATLTEIADPDLPGVSDVKYLAGRFYYLEADSDRWWFSALNDATSIDGLAFETAESAPDASIGAEVVGDELWFFGSQTVEPFVQTGDADAPLIRAEGRTFNKGCAAQASIVKLDNSVMWVTNERQVVRAAAAPIVISHPGIDERLRKCDRIDQCTAWSAPFDGHLCYVLNIPTQGTWVYDVSTQQWARWASYGRTTFRAAYGVPVNGTLYLGDDTDGTIWTLDPDAHADGTDPIVSVASAFLPLGSGVQRCDTVVLQCVRGVGDTDAPDPVAELRWSDDGGRTWSQWKARTLGAEGHYRDKAVWRQCGLMQSPGRAFEVRVSDPVIRALTGLTINEGRP